MWTFLTGLVVAVLIVYLLILISEVGPGPNHCEKCRRYYEEQKKGK